MPLKESKGNMYDWVTHVHTHLGGECPHRCVYCYVGKNRFGRAPRYTGELRMITRELGLNYGTGKVIFIEHMNDMFAEGMKESWIRSILSHCNGHDNEYVFQTKNPARAYQHKEFFPKKAIIGTTLESDIDYPKISITPAPVSRIIGIERLKKYGYKTFITIEPIMDFNIDVLFKWIVEAHPDFVNIGADSKRCGLPEPSKDKVLDLVKRLQDAGVIIRKKVNLERLMSA